MVTFDFYWYQFRYIDVICMDLETFTFTGASLVYKLSDLVIQYPGEHRKFAFIKLSHWTYTQMILNFAYENSNSHKLANFPQISVTIN